MKKKSISTLMSPTQDERDFLVLLGAYLRAMREEKGYTREDMYEKTCLTTRAVVNIENGTSNPKIITIRRLLNALQ